MVGGQRRKAAAEIVDCGAGVLGDLELPLVHGLDRLSAGNYATVLLVEVREPLERLAGRDRASRDLVADRARTDNELADLLADLAGLTILLVDGAVS